MSFQYFYSPSSVCGSAVGDVCVCVCMRAKAHLRVWIRARTHFVCVHVCVKCINRAYCQRCTAVEVAVAVAVSLSSLPVASN